MYTVPKPISQLVDQFQKLPGIGPKTAQRLTYYLLHVPQTQLDQFSQAVERLQKNTQLCKKCFAVSESEICSVCSDDRRDLTKICVVEQPLDVLALEKSGAYKGLYHVLHGLISPLDNIGPQQIHVYDLLTRLQDDSESVEIIIATNPTIEGEATALYIQKLLEEKYSHLSVTRIGYGLPIGGDIEYADEMTLTKAFEGRRKL